MSLEIKTPRGVRVKQVDDQGRATVVFATMNVVDNDGDVALPGAFGQQSVRVVPSHNWGHVPLGKGTTREEGNEALADLVLNMDIPSARDWHAALKFDMENGPPIQEWSYGYAIEDSGFGQHEGQDVRFLRKVKVHEISPVLLGAGIDTRTVDVKEENKRAVAAHSTETSERTWDGPANERRVKSDEAAAYYRRIYAWNDPDGDVGAKSSWRFIHHYIGSDGAPGPASTRAAVTGIAVLNGARGGTTIPAADRAGVHRHLARHLRDANMEPPELRSYDECASKLSEQIRFATWEAEAAIERAKEVQTMRQDEGRHLSKSSLEGLDGLRAVLDELHATATALEAALQKGDAPDEVASLFAEFEFLQMRAGA